MLTAILRGDQGTEALDRTSFLCAFYTSRRVQNDKTS
jgi:hypothetical protein